MEICRPVAADSAILTDDEKVHPIKCIQPSILRLADGRLKVLMRTHNAKLATSYSTDGGYSWSKVTLSDIPNNQSGTDAVTLKDGRHALVYNDFETLKGTKKGPRTPLVVAVSKDGSHFANFVTLEDSPVDQYSYPAIIQGSDNTLHIVYTWRPAAHCLQTNTTPEMKRHILTMILMWLTATIVSAQRVRVTTEKYASERVRYALAYLQKNFPPSATPSPTGRATS